MFRAAGAGVEAVVIPYLGDMLEALATAASGALATPVGRVLVAPGLEVAWDECCDGQLWARVVEARESDAVLAPARLADGSACGPGAWLVTFGVGVLRCTPSVDDRGRAPTADALTANALLLLEDQADVCLAIKCSGVVASPRGMAWAPLGPEGGCAGGEWTFEVLVQGCGCSQPA